MIPAAILSYGGINSFVIIFSVYPIALKLFEDADLPTYLSCRGSSAEACGPCQTGSFYAPNSQYRFQVSGDAILCRAASRLCSAAVMAVAIVSYEPGVQESQASGRTFSVA